MKKIATAMLTQFNQRFGDGRVETLPVKMVLAAALDPRTKQLAGIPAEQHDMVYAELRAMLLATSAQYSADTEATASSETAAVADDDDADSEPTCLRGWW